MTPTHNQAQSLDSIIVNEFNHIFEGYNRSRATKATLKGLSGKEYTVSAIPCEVAGAPSLCLVCKKMNPNQIEVYGPHEYALGYSSRELIVTHRTIHFVKAHPEALDSKEARELSLFFKHLVEK